MRPSKVVGAVCAGAFALAIGALLSTSPAGVPRGGTLLFGGPAAGSLITPSVLAPQALRRPAIPAAVVESGPVAQKGEVVALTSADVGNGGANVVGGVASVPEIIDSPGASGHGAAPPTVARKPTKPTNPPSGSPPAGGTGGVTTGTGGGGSASNPLPPDPPVVATPDPKGPVTDVVGDVTGGVKDVVTGVVTGIVSTGNATPASPSADAQPPTPESATTPSAATPAPVTVATPIATVSIDPNPALATVTVDLNLAPSPPADEPASPVVSSVPTVASDVVQVVAPTPVGGLLG